jgi:hypothetical protein
MGRRELTACRFCLSIGGPVMKETKLTIRWALGRSGGRSLVPNGIAEGILFSRSVVFGSGCSERADQLVIGSHPLNTIRFARMR